jgi:HPt (histidine-containing phosphotransfer) domain-containing protein
MVEIFDRVAAIDRVDGDISLLLDLVRLCREQCDSRMMVLMHDVRHKDLLAVKRHAHLLKGALGNVGAAAAYEAAVALEKAAIGERLDEVEPLAHTLIEAINEFFVTVEREL